MYAFYVCIDFKCLNSTWNYLTFPLSWYLYFYISELFIRENNVCDINPVHYLFATGTSEVSAMYVCKCSCVLVSVSRLNTVLTTLRAFVGIWCPHKCYMLLVAKCDELIFLVSYKMESIRTPVSGTWCFFPHKSKNNNDTLFHFPASTVCISWPFPYTPGIRVTI